MSAAVSIFCSYSHKDEPYRAAFEKILTILKQTQLIDVWHDRMITAGSDWAGQINENLSRADIVVLIVSSDFLASSYCQDKEMTLALEREARGEAVIVRSCDWEDAPFKRFQMIPKGAKPIANWKRKDDAWTDVSRALKATIRLVMARKFEKLKAQTNFDEEAARTIYSQIARESDAAHRRMENFKIMAELQAKIFEITKDIGPPLPKGIKRADTAFNNMDAYIRGTD